MPSISPLFAVAEKRHFILEFGEEGGGGGVGSRRERDFFLNISGFETRARYFLSKSHVSRWERDMQTNFSRSSEKK